MSNTYESGFSTTLAAKLESGDTTLEVATAPTKTKGRLFLQSGSKKEWIEYDGVSGTTLQNLTRDLSTTADPATSGTGKTWTAGTPISIVAMHDQLADRQEDNTFQGDILFDNVDVAGINCQKMTTTERNNITNVRDGQIIYNTSTGQLQKREGGSWIDVASGSTPNSDNTTAGKVETATDSEMDNGTDTGGTGANLVGTPSQFQRKAFAENLNNEGVRTSVGTKSFTLYENLSAGDLVKIINDGGTAKIKEAFVGLGSKNVFDSSTSDEISATQLDSNRVFIAYRDNGNSNAGTGVVATITGNTITYGSKNVFNSGNTSKCSTSLIDTDKVLIAYEDNSNSNKGTAIVATISGSTISYGSANIFDSNQVFNIASTDIDTNKVFIAYNDNTDTLGEGIVATVSGTTISYGTANTFNSAGSLSIGIAKLDTDKVIIGYNDSGNSNYGTGIVATVSSSTITYGSEQVFESADIERTAITQLDTDKIFIAYADEGNSGYGTGLVATISGTTITYGAKNVFNSADTNHISVVNIGFNQVYIAYSDNSNSNEGNGIIADINLTDITYKNRVVHNSGSTFSTSVVKLVNEKVFIAYEDAGNSNKGTGIVDNIYKDDVIGQLQEDGTAGDTKPIVMIGNISSQNSGLTPGEELRYGTAISSTDVLLHRYNV